MYHLSVLLYLVLTETNVESAMLSVVTCYRGYTRSPTDVTILPVPFLYIFSKLLFWSIFPQLSTVLDWQICLTTVESNLFDLTICDIPSFFSLTFLASGTLFRFLTLQSTLILKSESALSIVISCQLNFLFIDCSDNNFSFVHIQFPYRLRASIVFIGLKYLNKKKQTS